MVIYICIYIFICTFNVYVHMHGSEMEFLILDLCVHRDVYSSSMDISVFRKCILPINYREMFEVTI